MTKKKTPANAFYFFMLDRKAAYEINGEIFQNGLKDVSKIAGPEWNVLPAAEKKKYEEMARKEKERRKEDTARKYTNRHNSFDYMSKTMSQHEERKLEINKNIEMTISSLCCTRKIAGFNFYLIHVNYFCISDGQCYHPAELAVCEFSLAEGVTNVYHTIINAGQPPLGYRLDAMSRSDEVHRIPLDGGIGEKNIYVVWKNVKAMLERGRSVHGGSYPPMYTMPDNVNLNTSITCVRDICKMLSDCDEENAEEFLVYPLDKLFFELKLGCAEINGEDDLKSKFPSISFACYLLENDTYNYTEEIACSFHVKEDHVTNCSKSFVQRWAFIICDLCCGSLDITVVPGKHVPLTADVTPRHRNRERDLERENAEAVAKAAQKPFRMVDNSGKTVKYFAPVEREHRTLFTPTVQPTDPRPVVRPASTDSYFPKVSIGRGRGRFTPRGGGQVGLGRGSGPMSFVAAMQNKRGRRHEPRTYDTPWSSFQ